MPDKIESTALNAQKEIIRSRDLFLKKLHDYGVDDMTDPVQVIQRMREKIARIERLQVIGQAETKAETQTDTARDLIGYSLILTLMLNNEWGNTLMKEEIIPDRGVQSLRVDDKIQITRTPEAMEFSLPQPKKAGDVGYDLYTIKEIVIPHNTAYPVDVPTGCRIKLPVGTWGMIINRSSTPRKLGLEVVPGVIDNGYTGELFACVWNRTGEDVIVPKGSRLAQMVIFNSVTPRIIEVNNLPDTERGETGFGSTNHEEASKA